MKTYNYEYERMVLSSSEFKGYIVKSSNDYSVTLIKQNKDKTEEIIIYASYLVDLWMK